MTKRADRGRAVRACSAPRRSPKTTCRASRSKPSWPKPLPNNWILGQVAGIATDKYDRIWVVQRPLSLTPRERAAELNPPEAKCCKAAPPVLLFDASGNLLRHWGGPGPGLSNGRRTSTASSSTTMISSGSPATARRTASCSSSRWTASSCCRSASRARATTAMRPTGSARRPMWRSMSRRRKCSRPTATPTAASSCSIRKPAPTSATGAPTATSRSTRRRRPTIRRARRHSSSAIRCTASGSARTG